MQQASLHSEGAAALLSYSHEPFLDTADPAFYYPFEFQEKVLSKLIGEIERGKRLHFVLGDEGTGKTLLGNLLETRLGKNRGFTVRKIEDPTAIPSTHLLSGNRGDLQGIKDLFLRTGSEKLVLIIDEGQAIQENFWRLVVFVMAYGQTRIVILGQPPLDQVLRLDSLRPYLGVTAWLPYPTFSEMVRFVEFRLKRAGLRQPGGFFDSKSYELLYSHTLGRPRQVLRYCQEALDVVSRSGEAKVTSEILSRQVLRSERENAKSPRPERLYLRQPVAEARNRPGSWKKSVNSLASLMPHRPSGKTPESRQSEKTPIKKSAVDKLEEIPLDLIVSNPYQPRRKFDEQKLMELSQSIRQLGVLEPVILREVGERYELVAGERRVKASRIAGNRTIPALVRDLSDQEALEIALIENLQRENLNPVERAEAYQRISKEFLYLTPDQLASRVAKEQGEIVEDLRLMKLPLVAQKALVEQVINREEAEEILGIPEPSSQLSALELVVREKMRKKVDRQ